MKRYLTWKHDNYYPGGAEDDFIGDFDTEQEAQDSIPTNYRWDRPKQEYRDGHHSILDTETGQWL